MTRISGSDYPESEHFYLGGRFETERWLDWSNEDILYLGGDAMTAPVVLKRYWISDEDDPEEAEWTVYNIGRDNLGSVTHIVSPAGTKVAEASYDAWGRTRSVSNWDLYEYTDPQTLLYRGYAGYPFLQTLGLYHASARIYDPLTGRFLGYDPVVQDPFNSQNFNKYSYCLNNPFRYTDPSGDIFTWNISLSGLPFGLNFALLGVPLGFGLNIGWSNGFSLGAYGEFGARIGGTGFGYGLTTSVSYDYNFKANKGLTTFSFGGYASYGFLNASGGVSSSDGQSAWSIGTGFNLFGGDQSGMGLSISYGTSGFSVGLGGYVTRDAFPEEVVRFRKLSYCQEEEYNNCVPSTLSELSDIFGGNLSYEEAKTLVDYKEDTGVTTSLRQINQYINQYFECKECNGPIICDSQYMKESSKKGYQPTLYFTNYKDVEHMDNVKKITYYRDGSIVLKLRVENRYSYTMSAKSIKLFMIHGLKP